MPDNIQAAVADVIATPEVPAQEVEATEVENTEEAAEGQELSSDEKKLEDLENADTSKMSKAEKKELEKQIKKFKLKVDGKEEDFEIDLNNEEELKRHLQKSKASDKRMQESAELRKAAEKFIETLRKNPRKVLSDPTIGVDVKKLAQEIIDEEIANAQKTPEELEREQLKKELEELRTKAKEEEEKRKQDEFERLQAQTQQQLEKGIHTALESGNIPKSPYAIKKMAEMMSIALKNDIDLSPEEVVPLVRKQILQDIKDMFNTSSDELFEEMFKENIARVRKKSVSKAKQAVQTASSVKPTGEKPKVDSKEPEKMSLKEFLKI